MNATHAKYLYMMPLVATAFHLLIFCGSPNINVDSWHLPSFSVCPICATTRLSLQSQTRPLHPVALRTTATDYTSHMRRASRTASSASAARENSLLSCSWQAAAAPVPLRRLALHIRSPSCKQTALT